MFVIHQQKINGERKKNLNYIDIIEMILSKILNKVNKSKQFQNENHENIIADSDNNFLFDSQ